MSEIRQDHETMERFAKSYREALRPGGGSVGEMLTASSLDEIFQKHGLKIVPVIPTPAMQAAWKQGAFRGFFERYSAMLQAVW